MPVHLPHPRSPRHLGVARLATVHFIKEGPIPNTTKDVELTVTDTISSTKVFRNLPSVRARQASRACTTQHYTVLSGLAAEWIPG